MKQKEIVELTDKQLKEMLGDERLSFARMHLSHSISSHENPMKLRDTKKKIARLLTEKKAREMKAGVVQIENISDGTKSKKKRNNRKGTEE